MELIAAADKNWAIGRDGKLLCHLPGDLKYFKEKTTGKTVVMGRKTLESLPGSKPLPNRRNIVLTKDPSFEKEGCEIVHSGASVYEQLLPYCDSCYITKIDACFDADTYIVNLDERDDFQLEWHSQPMEENGFTYRFTRYDRKTDI